MVRRHEGTAFMGGAHVFPGGRVDASDHDADATWCDGLEHAQRQLASVTADEARAYHVAAARELFEEAGVLLARSANGQFVSLAGADAHARFKQYRSDVHKGAATLRAIVERETLRLAVDSLMLFAHWVTPPVDFTFQYAPFPAGHSSRCRSIFPRRPSSARSPLGRRCSRTIARPG